MSSDSNGVLFQNRAHRRTEHAVVDPVRLVGEPIRAHPTARTQRLTSPALGATPLEEILAVAGGASDHGGCLPWPRVIAPKQQRPGLAEVRAQALLEQDPSATGEQAGRAREEAFRSPVLRALVADVQCGDVASDRFEQSFSAGCAGQNILLMATALGWGAVLAIGNALKAQGHWALHDLHEGEHAQCFIHIGTVAPLTTRCQRPGLTDPARVRAPSVGDYRGADLQTTREE